MTARTTSDDGRIDPKTVPADPIDAYRDVLERRNGFIVEESPMRPRRARMTLAAWVVGVLTTAALFGGIGYAVGAAVAAV